MRVRVSVFSTGTLVLWVFILAPLLFAGTGINLNNWAYLFGALAIVFYLLSNPLSESSVLYFILIYLLWTAFYTLFIARFYSIDFFYSLKQFTYYLKPIFFFLLGYAFIRQGRFDRVTVFLLLFLTVGSFVYYLDWGFFIQKALERSPEAQGEEHFFSLGGLVRNASLLLSPLDLGFVTFFLSAYFFFRKRPYLGLTALFILISTVTRSAIIAFIVSISLSYFMMSKLVNKFFYVILFIITLISMLIVFNNQLEYLFIRDGSASLHIENFRSVLTAFIQAPLGKGIGYSGWATVGKEGYLYSEGSFFSSLLENGLVFVIFYISVGAYIYRLDRLRLFPIYIGFITASLLIPIGYSTLFNLVFFTSFGIKSREHLENRNRLAAF